MICTLSLQHRPVDATLDSRLGVTKAREPTNVLVMPMFERALGIGWRQGDSDIVHTRLHADR